MHEDGFDEIWRENEKRGGTWKLEMTGNMINLVKIDQNQGLVLINISLDFKGDQRVVFMSLNNINDNMNSLIRTVGCT